MDMTNCVGVIHSVCLEEVEVLDAFNEGMNFRVPQTILGDIFCLFHLSHFLPIFPATSLPGHSPTCDVCVPPLLKPIVLNCASLSLSL